MKEISVNTADIEWQDAILYPVGVKEKCSAMAGEMSLNHVF